MTVFKTPAIEYNCGEILRWYFTVLNLFSLENRYFKYLVLKYMVDHRCPILDYKQVLSFGIFIWNDNTLELNCQYSLVYIFIFGISEGLMEEEVCNYYLLT